MMTNTPGLGIQYLEGSQSQKHDTVNEAFRKLDLVVQPTVLDKDLSAPPASPAPGDKYLVAPGATGAWAGQENAMAGWMDGSWFFATPKHGWVTYVADENKQYSFDGTDWTEIEAGGSTDLTEYARKNVIETLLPGLVIRKDSDDTFVSNEVLQSWNFGDGSGYRNLSLNGPTTTGNASPFQFMTSNALNFLVDNAKVLELTSSGMVKASTALGIGGATPDTTNVLSLNGPAALFNHGGAGIQLKLNKNSVGDSASFLFQTGFSARAEIGLTGTDDLTFKVSPDNSTFYDGLILSKDNGNVRMPNQPMLKVAGTYGWRDITTAHTDIILDNIVINQGGGAYNAATGHYTIPSAGTYLLIVNGFIGPETDARVSFARNGATQTSDMQVLEGEVPLAMVALFPLNKGDTVSVRTGNVVTTKLEYFGGHTTFSVSKIS